MRKFITLVCAMGFCVACGSKDQQANETVRAVFENFEPTMAKIIELGLEAKGASTQGANITPLSASGDEGGSLTIGGKIAQSTGENHNLELWVQLEDNYSDTGTVFYTTDNSSDASKLQFALQIKNQPQDNTMAGALAGLLELSGDVEGTANFDLQFSTDLTDDNADAAVICSRVTGTVGIDADSVAIDFISPEDLNAFDEAQREKCLGL